MKNYISLISLLQSFTQMTSKQRNLLEAEELITAKWYIKLEKQLGEALTPVLVYLFECGCQLNEHGYNRLVRYQKENRINDLLAAIQLMAQASIIINQCSLYALLGRTKTGGNFLPTARMLNYAMMLGVTQFQFSPSDKGLDLLRASHVDFYDQLASHNALNKDVIANFSNFTPPTSAEQIDNCVRVYSMALSYKTVLSQLNKFKKSSVVQHGQAKNILDICDYLATQGWLNESTFTLACLTSSYHKNELLLALSFIYRGDINAESVLRIMINTLISSNAYSLLSTTNKFFIALGQSSHGVCSEKIIEASLSLPHRLQALTASIEYLLQRHALNQQSLELLVFYYDKLEQSEKINPPIPPQKSYSLNITSNNNCFFTSKTETLPTVEPAEIVFAIDYNGLTSTAYHVMEKLTLELAHILLRLFYLNQLNSRTMAYLLSLDSIDDNTLPRLLASEKDHQSSPNSMRPSNSHFNQLTVDRLQQEGFDLEIDGKDCWLINFLDENTLDDKEIGLLKELAQCNQLNEAFWQRIEALELKEVEALTGLFYGLNHHGLCHEPYLTHLIEAPNKLIAYDSLVRLSASNIEISKYWSLVIHHPLPSFFITGLINLQEEDCLSEENAENILLAKRPDIAAKAWIEIIHAGKSTSALWPQLVNMENPLEQVEILLSSSRLESLPLHIKENIKNHSHPKLYIKLAEVLLSIPNVEEDTLLALLKHKQAEKIVMDLKDISEITPINALIIEILKQTPNKATAVKAYLALTDKSYLSLEELHDVEKAETAELLVTLAPILSQQPALSDDLKKALLLQRNYDAKQALFVEAVMMLAEAQLLDSISLNAISMDFNFASSKKIASFILKLNTESLYSHENLRKTINNSSDFFYACLDLIEENHLTQAFINLYKMKLYRWELFCLGEFIFQTNAQPYHREWLIHLLQNADENDRQWIAFFFMKLSDVPQLLTHSFIDKIINRFQLDSMPYAQAGEMLEHIPAKLLDETVIEAMFNSKDICYTKDDGGRYNPFKVIQQENPDLLTKEVIQVILQQSAFDSYQVVHIAKKLKKNHLFEADNISDCVNQHICNGYIALATEGLLTQKNKALLKKHRFEDDLAKLIIMLVNLSFYDDELYYLLGQQKISRSYFGLGGFATIIVKLLNEQLPEIKLQTLKIMLYKKLDWSRLSDILSHTTENNLSDDLLVLVANTDLAYLQKIVLARFKSPEYTRTSTSELICYCQYQSILNQPNIINVLDSIRSNAVDQQKIAAAFSLLPMLCADKEKHSQIAELFEQAITPKQEQASTFPPNYYGLRR